MDVRLRYNKQTEIVMRSQKGAKKEIRQNMGKMQLPPYANQTIRALEILYFSPLHFSS